MKIQPWQWNSGKDSARLLEEFDRNGLCVVKMPDSIEIASKAPESFVAELFGRKPLAYIANDIKVRDGGKSYAHTSMDANFHIDQHPFMPPNVQLLVCVRQAADPGGVSVNVDTFHVLESLKKNDTDLYNQLFETPRAIHFHNMVWYGPTISLRGGHLISCQGPMRKGVEPLGKRFEAAYSRQEPWTHRLSEGEVIINSNHRTLHARTAFTDTNRHLIRILAWFDEPFSAPHEYLEKAKAVEERAKAHAREYPEWLQKRLGLHEKSASAPFYSEHEISSHYGRKGLQDTPEQSKLLQIACKQIYEGTKTRRSA